MSSVTELAKEALRISEQNGFWDEGNNRNKGEMIALMHSELSEALEAIRHGDPESQKVPGHSHTVEELADCCIRIFDFCQGFGYDLETAIKEKMRYNATRPYKHGKRF